MARGVDADTDLSGIAVALAADGYEFACRYLPHEKASHLSHAEVAALSDAGLWVVSIWERGDPTSQGYFTARPGVSDAHGIVAAAAMINQPKGKPIYVTVDFDCGTLDAIHTYFAELRDIVFKKSGWPLGVYGSGFVCSSLKDLGIVEYTWLAQATGWAGYDLWRGRADIVQGPGTVLHGISVDLNESNGHAGGWQRELPK